MRGLTRLEEETCYCSVESLEGFSDNLPCAVSKEEGLESNQFSILCSNPGHDAGRTKNKLKSQISSRYKIENKRGRK